MLSINVHEKWLEAERLFSQNRYRGPDDGDVCRLDNRQTVPLLCSLHGVSHFKSATEDKVPDLFTGGLVFAIGHCHKVSTLINLRTSPSINPHIGKPLAFSLLGEFLEENPRTAIFDIHGCKNSHNFDVAIGLGREPEDMDEVQDQLLQNTIEACKKTGMKYGLNVPGLSAKSPRTLTKFALNLDYSNVIQLELTRDIREPEGPRALQTLEFFASLLNSK